MQLIMYSYLELNEFVQNKFDIKDFLYNNLQIVIEAYFCCRNVSRSLYLETVALNDFDYISFETNDTATIQIILTILYYLCYLTVLIIFFIFIYLFIFPFYKYVAVRQKKKRSSMAAMDDYIFYAIILALKIFSNINEITLKQFRF